MDTIKKALYLNMLAAGQIDLRYIENTGMED